MRPVTTCAFCNIGCYLEGDGKNGMLNKVEYHLGTIYEGRLCPRGNAASILYNHPKRLFEPRIKTKRASWKEVKNLLLGKTKEFKKDEIAIVFDESLTREEVEAVQYIAGFFNTEKIYWGFAEPEAVFSYIKKKVSKIEEIEGLDAAFVIGDMFSKAPVAANFIIKRREKFEEFSLIVVDAFKSVTSKFATASFILPVQRIPFFLYALCVFSGRIKKPIFSKDRILEILKIKEENIKIIVETLEKKKTGIFYVPCSGRSFDPILDAWILNLIFEVFDKTVYFPIGIRLPEGDALPTGELVSDTASGAVKGLLCFGPRFPFMYPHIKPFIKKVKFSMFSSYFAPGPLFSADVILPLLTPFEKQGKIHTFFDERTLTPLGNFSGAKDVSYIANMLEKGKKVIPQKVTFKEIEVKKRFERLIEKKKKKKDYNFILLGEERAFGFYELFNQENYIKLNPSDAAEFRIKSMENVNVETDKGRTALVAVLTPELEKRTAVLSMNHIESRAVMEFVIDAETGDAFISPTWGKIWKA